ncbi:AraC family transcriptional regulator [Pandoraea sp.]|uniref:AraC family transcriptional regulator n=1 Tax=Pandoraea sp. TaxID=1883445 RepID=UPI00122AFAC1|nr:AraC family transcriptional regulator [Pandoraea sp.]TAL53179.1 MAG: AraC family transcriptional regulator [Pandoraea sp.]TAM20613.1 MAG: AraC family transcriptional regulator [Pandoraea sp.]
MNAASPIALPHSGTRVRLRSSAGLGWHGFGADLMSVSAGLHRIPAMPVHRIGVHVGTPVKAHCRCENQRRARLQAHGDADVIPAGLDGQWTDDASCTIFSIWIGEPLARKTFDQLNLKTAQAGIRPQLQLRDIRFQHLAWALRAELEADEASDPLYAESLCTAMIVRLIGTVPSLEDRRRRKLAPVVATRLIEYIDSHLAERLTLVELAAMAGLSVPHFKVLFRETLGMPVHRYVIQRRVERASMLLEQGKLGASQIALDTGFAHQSHMAHWMNRLLGVSPRDIVAANAPVRRTRHGV